MMSQGSTLGLVDQKRCVAGVWGCEPTPPRSWHARVRRGAIEARWEGPLVGRPRRRRREHVMHCVHTSLVVGWCGGVKVFLGGWLKTSGWSLSSGEAAVPGWRRGEFLRSRIWELAVVCGRQWSPLPEFVSYPAAADVPGFCPLKPACANAANQIDVNYSWG